MRRGRVQRFKMGILTLLLSAVALTACGRSAPSLPEASLAPWYADSLAGAWADSVVKTLTLRERIAQSFVVSAYSNKSEAYEDALVQLVDEHRVGGVLFFQGTTVRQAELTNRLQSSAKVPLLVTIDAEWGLGMRLSDALSYPRAMAFAAAGEPRYAYRLGKDLAAQMRRLGVHVNFAPVADINTDGENPVIGVRSYGDDAATVETYARAYASGLEQNGVLSCLKHFPGHGNTKVDSHKGLPRLSTSRGGLDSVELRPFKNLTETSSMVMLAHMDVPAITGSSAGLPVSLSPRSVELLREEYGFKGLICTDALNMQGAAANRKAWEVNAMAYEAGVDLLLCVEQVPETLQRIERRVKAGAIDTASITERAKRILRAKCFAIGPSAARVELQNLREDLHRSEYNELLRSLAESGIVMLREGDIPFDSVANRSMGYVSFLSKDSMYATLREYFEVPRLALSARSGGGDAARIAQFAKGKTNLVVAVEAIGTSPRNGFGIGSKLARIQQCASLAPTTVVLYGSPYALRWLDTIKGVEGLVLCCSERVEYQQEAARVLLGVRPAEGRLPVWVNGDLPRGAGTSGRGSGRLSYVVPSRMVLDSVLLARADSLACAAIDSQAMPGMQIVAGCDGVVFYAKQFGHFTYDPNSPRVTDSTLYDVASLTKVVVTVPVLMSEIARGAMSLSDTLGCFFTGQQDTGAVLSARVNDVLLHQAGLAAYAPFYLRTVESLLPGRAVAQRRMNAEYCIDIGSYGYMSKHAVPSRRFYRTRPEAPYTMALSDHLYAAPSIRDSVYQSIFSQGLSPRQGYRYSDFGYILLGRAVELLEEKPLDVLADSILFSPLGMRRTLFNPAQQGLARQCAPTENELTFRRSVVQGYVHDLTAAMLGGVAGHAGLFSTSHDLAKYAQMLLNGGRYGGYSFFSPSMVSLFTKVPVESVNKRRAYGFDTRMENQVGSALVGDSLSAASYGHTGFTGTILWIDPTKNFFFVFLSNRVYPEASNQRINTLKVRSQIMNTLYNAVISY